MTMNLLSRRSALAAVSALMLAACGGGDSGSTATDVPAITKGDHIKGSENAPVTIIEYASPTCPACKYFHDEILPVLTEKYVVTGKVKFVFREYPIHEPDLPSYVLANCAGEDQFFPVLDDLFANQMGIVTAAQAGALKGALQTIGKRHGIETEAQFNACMENRDYRTALADKYQVATEKWSVDSTPTFIVNGKKHLFENETRTAEGFSKYIDGLLGEDAPAATEAAAPAEDAAPATEDAGASDTTEQ